MNKREKRFYEKFKKSKITLEDLKKAKSFTKYLGNISEKFELLIRMMISDFKGEFNISVTEKITIIGAIVYVINPFDAVPDILPFFGFADDIAVVTYIFTKINSLILKYENYENTEIKNEKDRNVDLDILKVVNEDEGE